MMTYADSGKAFYSILFLISMLPSIYAVADTADLPPNTSIQDTKLENINDGTLTDTDTEEFPEDAPLRDNPNPEEPFFSFLDKPQEVISSGVEALAQTLDEYFSEDEVFYDSSGTYLRLQGDFIWNEKGDVRNTGDIRLKLRLPHSKKKLKFLFETDADERPDDISNKIPVETEEKNNYFTGIQATLGKEDGWQFKPSLGLSFSSGIHPYVRFRFKRKYELPKWSIHWHENAYWFDSLGWGFDSYLELNRKISDDTLFRASTFARWTHEIDHFELSQTFSMLHTLSKRRAISYYTGVYGISEPTVFATNYLLGATYRQNIHKDYLFFELIPQIKYQKTNDFHAEHSLTLRLEIVFKK